ncbi:hypothetical protein GCM10010112_42500 [Actinoplanes lobatus]|uniref:Uncharacterized protein n=1 Tax=Actinoplanes lobatus TaxID=113568 RepID=A0ABQ4AFE5_9ACTN|nr:hypothetical protein GCM10010112_42500 [Actinoplanes lobatus]GIE39729.1 hypothetical protein Alo02nite_26270 [Actinoplanes lobatus]
MQGGESPVESGVVGTEIVERVQRQQEGGLLRHAHRADPVGGAAHVPNRWMNDLPFAEFVQVHGMGERGEPATSFPVTAALDRGAQPADFVVLPQQGVNYIEECHRGLRSDRAARSGPPTACRYRSAWRYDWNRPVSS